MFGGWQYHPVSHPPPREPLISNWAAQNRHAAVAAALTQGRTESIVPP